MFCLRKPYLPQFCCGDLKYYVDVPWLSEFIVSFVPLYVHCCAVIWSSC